jgi:RimJ/RimL family protein N-acetyltransferase
MTAMNTGRLLLSPLVNTDAMQLFRIMADPDTMQYWAAGPHATVAQTYEWIANVEVSWKTNGFGDWSVRIEATGDVIGFCGLHYVQGMAEVNIGYVLDKLYWGKGYGTEASLAALTFGFSSAEVNLIAGVTDPRNVASIKVLEKCGMSYCRRGTRNGKDRVFYTMTRARWNELELQRDRSSSICNLRSQFTSPARVETRRGPQRFVRP